MKLVIRKNFSLGFALLLLLFLFQDPISSMISIVSYVDEIESIILLFILLCSVMFRKKKLLDTYQRRFMCTFIFLIIVGLIGNMISSYQRTAYILLDILVYSKIVINLFAANLITNNSKLKRYEDTAWKVTCSVSIILFILVIHETLAQVPIWPYLSDRYGVRSLRLFFSNQTFLAQIGVILLIIHYNLGKHRKSSILFYLADMIIAISTFRTKALGFIAAAAIIIFIVDKKKKITKLNIMCIGIILVMMVVAVGSNYFLIYYNNDASLRFIILQGGIKLAGMHIPWGAGFGTYCSLGAKINYSLAYDVLEMRSEYQRDYMYDNFWASVIGQLGYLGFLLYIVLIIQLVLMVLRIRKVNTRKFWTAMLLCAYLIIASLGETSFNAFYACPMGLYIGYLYNNVKNVQQLSMTADRLEENF